VEKEPPNYRPGDVNEYGNVTKTCNICWHLRYFPGSPDKTVCIRYLKRDVGLFNVCDSWKSFRNRLEDSTLNEDELRMVTGFGSRRGVETI